MPLRIPLPTQGGEALQRGVEHGTSMFSNLLGHGIQRQQLGQSWQQHLQNLALQQQQEARLQQLLPYQIAEHENKQLSQPLSLDLLRAKIAHEQAKTQNAINGQTGDKAARQRQLINSHVWNSLPASSKENLTALANGLNIRPDVFVKGMTEGKTFEDIAEEHGIDRSKASEVIPKYLATTSNVTQQNQRQQNLSELSAIENLTTDWMAPYSRKFAGMSPKQIVDSFGGKNDDALAKYYAALALQPEIAALRIKAMGGNMSHAGLEDIIKANFGKSKISEAQVGPKVYKLMNHYLAEALKAGSSAATNELYGRPGNTNSHTNKGTKADKKRKSIDLMTKSEIDAELAEAEE
jgi:hypothetical protein